MQEAVFGDLGLYMLQNAWEGYNCSLFAYGQTGAGKSYTVLGASGELDTSRDSDHGLLPRLANALFESVAEKCSGVPAPVPPEADTTAAPRPVEYVVEVSYLEIYNEQIRDLFKPEVKRVPALGGGVSAFPGTAHSPHTIPPLSALLRVRVQSGHLRVREHKETGPYVANLSWLAVESYAEMERYVACGTVAQRL